MKERTGAEKRSLLREVAEERVLRGNGIMGAGDWMMVEGVRVGKKGKCEAEKREIV